MLMQPQYLGEATESTHKCRLFPTQQIMVAADRSEPAGWALSAAAKLAGQFDCDQNVVYVAPPLTANEPEVVRLMEESRMARLETDQRLIDNLPAQPAEGRQVRRLQRRGVAADEILGADRQTQPDLLVIGTHGRHGLKRLLLGSVATEVVRHATCPVLCLSHMPADVLGRRIVLGVDFDEASHAAARWAGELALQIGGKVLLVHAVPPPALVQPGYGLVSEDLIQRHHRLARHLLSEFKAMLPPECDVEVQLTDGPAGLMLVEAAKGWRADLLVVGHTVSTVLKRALLGSTTETVLRRAECPVLCVTHDTQIR
jgi:nucleotide-binding universal stress UspA family protein